jgi:hypothetical protein
MSSLEWAIVRPIWTTSILLLPLPSVFFLVGDGGRVVSCQGMNDLLTTVLSIVVSTTTAIRGAAICARHIRIAFSTFGFRYAHQF